MIAGKPLTKAEEQVMMVLWKLGKGFLKDVLEHTAEPKPHPNPIATLLKILVEKGGAPGKPISALKKITN